MGDQNNQQGQQNAANNNQQGQAPGLAQNLGVPPALQPGQQHQQAGMGIAPPLPHQPGFIGPLPPPPPVLNPQQVAQLFLQAAQAANPNHAAVAANQPFNPAVPPYRQDPQYHTKVYWPKEVKLEDLPGAS